METRIQQKKLYKKLFLVAVKDIKKFRGECKLSTWLCQISKYIWYKKLKNTNKEISLDMLTDTLFIEESLEEIISEKEEKVTLFKRLQDFDEETRNVMYLRILENFEYNEIAEILGKTSNWARVVFFRGKQKLKEELDNEE